MLNKNWEVYGEHIVICETSGEHFFPKEREELKNQHMFLFTHSFQDSNWGQILLSSKCIIQCVNKKLFLVYCSDFLCIERLSVKEDHFIKLHWTYKIINNLAFCWKKFLDNWFLNQKNKCFILMPCCNGLKTKVRYQNL